MATTKLTVPILLEWKDIEAYVAQHDIVEVVRCKDCKYFNPQHHYCEGIGYWFGLEDEWSDNGFCYKGEQKETEDYDDIPMEYFENGGI